MRRGPFLVIAVVALLAFAKPLMLGEVLTFRDHSDYFQPLRWFTAQELRHGRLPLWNAYNASGEPWLANPQTGVFYPPAWMFVVLPFATAYVLYLCVHLILLGCGAFLLFSRFASAGAALAAALALMFCGPTMSLLDINNNLTTFAWIPLILWCAISEAGPQWSALAIAMSFLAGEPFFAAAGALLFALLRRRGLINIALTSIGFAAIELFPFLEFVRGSDRTAGVPRAQLLRDSMPLRDWLGLMLPIPYGQMQHFIPIVYVGALTVLFALIAVVKDRLKPVSQRVCVAAVAICMIVAAGAYLPPLGSVLTHLPVAIFRYPARMVPLAALAVTLLASMGIDRALHARWRLAIAAVMCADVLLQTVPLLHSGPFDPRAVPYDRAIGRDAKIVRVGIESAPQIERPAWIAGYLNLYDRRFDAWTAAPLVDAAYGRFYESAVFRLRIDLIDQMSGGYVLAPHRLIRFEPITWYGHVAVHRNRGALPMAYFRDDSGRLTPAKWLAFTTSSAFAGVDAPSDGVLVVTQRDAPGWRVEVDGKPAAAARAGLFRAVLLTRGHHEVRWLYRPISSIAGAAVTLIAVLRLLLSMMFVKGRAHENFFRAALKIA